MNESKEIIFFAKVTEDEIDYSDVINQIDKQMLEFGMKKYRGNQSLAAKELGISRATFRKKLKTHGFI